ncbi:MAG: FHA domain-containing protein [Pseudomonadota bacterium]
MADNTQFTVHETPAPETDGEKRPCLIMIRGDFIGQVYELTKDVNMLGRGEDMDLVISDISISRRHAMIVNRVDGFHLSDLSSTNGSFVNKVEVSDPAPLREGDKVSLGNVVFKFTYQDEDDTNYHMMLRNMAIKDGLTRIFNRR